MPRSTADTVHIAIGLLGTSRPFTVLHRALYRRLGGRGPLRHGHACDTVLLTTRGRRSGEPRTLPLFAFPVDGTGTDPGRWVVDGYSGYDVYRRRTDRTIPVVVLEPA